MTDREALRIIELVLELLSDQKKSANQEVQKLPEALKIEEQPLISPDGEKPVHAQTIALTEQTAKLIEKINQLKHVGKWPKPSDDGEK